MPYIKQDDRMKFNEGINSLLDAFGEGWTAGELNYVISMIALGLFDKNKKYQTINDIFGAIEGAKLEFNRRRVGPYEDEKIKENGDI